VQTWSFVLLFKFSAGLTVLCSETRPNAKPETVKQKLKNNMKKISIACLISGMLSVLVGVAIKNSTGSHSLLFMGLLLEATALVLFLMILFRK